MFARITMGAFEDGLKGNIFGKVNRLCSRTVMPISRSNEVEVMDKILLVPYPFYLVRGRPDEN
jgi:hypothetical protein